MFNKFGIKIQENNLKYFGKIFQCYISCLFFHIILPRFSLFSFTIYLPRFCLVYRQRIVVILKSPTKRNRHRHSASGNLTEVWSKTRSFFSTLCSARLLALCNHSIHFYNTVILYLVAVLDLGTPGKEDSISRFQNKAILYTDIVRFFHENSNFARFRKRNNCNAYLKFYQGIYCYLFRFWITAVSSTKTL